MDGFNSKRLQIKSYGHQEGPTEKNKVIGSGELFQLEFLHSEVFTSVIFAISM